MSISAALQAGLQHLSQHRVAWLCAAGLGTSIAAAWLWSSRSQHVAWRPDRLKQVGVVSQLFVYPIKSCKGVSISEAECTEMGLKNGELRDRHWLVVTEDGHMVTARQEPRMVLISISQDGSHLRLHAPDVEDVLIPFKLPKSNRVMDCRIFGNDIQGRDCGDEVANWITTFLKTNPYRLVQFELHMKPRYPKDQLDVFRPTDQVAYPDASPVMLLSETSLEDLNTKLAKKVSIHNFRPCIVVTDCSAFQEDSWHDVVVGTVELKRIMACSRCILTTVDPDTGIIDHKEPLDTLKTYRMCDPSEKPLYKSSPLFGQYFAVEKVGMLHVGDPVYKIIQ
ncbi:mitochondrial amidoxime reducing component 2-like [Ambystoma mexicanum]|uniref:mitochondrial amidoxime reducing component 2-like n=1 Tax=Ambystoma mexicanum TaxID=8296 RepID=UPI0037E70990